MKNLLHKLIRTQTATSLAKDLIDILPQSLLIPWLHYGAVDYETALILMDKLNDLTEKVSLSYSWEIDYKNRLVFVASGIRNHERCLDHLAQNPHNLR